MGQKKSLAKNIRLIVFVVVLVGWFVVGFVCAYVCFCLLLGFVFCCCFFGGRGG